MSKKQNLGTGLVTSMMIKIGMSNKALLTILGLIVLSGGSYGGYAIYEKNARTDYQNFPPVYVKEVLDGDTFILETGERIRLSEIDAPETNKCYGPEATAALEKLLRGQPLRIVKDIEGTDNFGRLIRYVVLEKNDPRESNILVNRYMVENGFAKYSASVNSMYQKEIIQSENAARSKFVGMWGACKNALTEKDSQPKRVIEANVAPTDPSCIIKGNVSDLGYGKKYLLPHCPNYGSVKIDPAKGEAYFCTEKEALAAGFLKTEGCE